MAARWAAVWKRVRLLVCLLAAGAFLFLLPASFTAPLRVAFNEAVAPVQTGLFQAGGDAAAAAGTLAEMFRRSNAERALRKEVTNLQNRVAALTEALRRANARLQQVQSLQISAASYRIVQAPVTSYDADPLRRSITVRAGRRDGVEPGLAAVAVGTLAGVVVESGPHTSRVRLITDPASAVPCRVGRTRSPCILVGTGGSTCKVDWLDREAIVEPGDVLYTSGLGVHGAPLLPQGLPAATVRSVGTDPMQPLLLAVEATPRVNLERLEEVQILIPEDGR